MVESKFNHILPMLNSISMTWNTCTIKHLYLNLEEIGQFDIQFDNFKMNCLVIGMDGLIYILKVNYYVDLMFEFIINLN